MSASPSHYRREGRNAFTPDAQPEDLNPYKDSPAFDAPAHYKDWQSGWYEALWKYEAKKQDEEENPDPMKALEERVTKLEELMELFEIGDGT